MQIISKKRVFLSIVSIIMLVCTINTIAVDEIVGCWNFDENTGTVVYDSSGYQNDGSLTYMTSPWINGIDRYALQFDGTDDYVNCGNSGILNPVDAMTITAWIRLDESSGHSNTIVNRGYANSTGAIYWLVVREWYRDVKFYWGDGTTMDTLTTTASIPVDEWHHIAATFDSGEVRLYIDGELAASKTSSVATMQQQSWDTQIGRYWTIGHCFDGAIDDVRIYNYALNENIIRNISERIDGSWEMNENNGTTTLDVSGNDNIGILMNTASPWVEGHLDLDGYFRYALQFDGTDDYVNCGNSSTLNPVDAMTITAWIKLDESSGHSNTIVNRGYANSTGAIYWLVVREWYRDVKFYWGDGTTMDTLTTTASIPVDEWHHIAATFDSGEVRLYIDGELAASKTSSVVTMQQQAWDTQIGRYWTIGHYFDGAIDKVNIYSRALAQEEIQANQLLSAYACHNYYTTENGIAVSTINVASTAGLNGNSYLVVKDYQDNSLGATSYFEDITDVTFDTSSLNNGINELKVELRKNSGELVFNTKLNVIKRTPNTGNEVKIDHKNGVVLRNGSGFFPIGIYMHNIPSSGTTEFQEVANAGFNTIIRLQNSGVSPSDSTTYLESAALYSLMVVDHYESYTVEVLSNYRWDTEQYFWDAYVDERDDIIDAVGYAKQESNLLAYYSFDEPLVSQVYAGVDIYKETNLADGYHPVFGLLAPGTDQDIYNNACDIGGVDTYIIPTERGVNWVTKYATIAGGQCRSNRKPFWLVLLTEYLYNKRPILPEEQYCQAYLGLIHGAKGIFYFLYPILHESTLECLDHLNNEIADLAPSMLTPDLEQAISYSKWDYTSSVYVSTPFDPANDVFVDVQVSLRKAPVGESYDYVLLATNTSHYSVGVNYTISLLGSSGTVYRRVFDTNDTNQYNVTNSVFGDTLEAKATRAYTFSSTSTAPITINVAVTPPQTIPTEESSYPRTGRPGKTNLFRNPNLEAYSLNNWPDYCIPWYVDQDSRIGTANQSWGLVTTSDLSALKTAIDNDDGNPDGDGAPGSTCLKITKTGEIAGFYSYQSLTASQDYVFSVYAKKIGSSTQRLRMGAEVSGYVNYNLTETWSRYTYSFTAPSGPAYDLTYNAFSIRALDEGVIMVDAVQLEQSSSISGFTTN